MGLTNRKLGIIYVISIVIIVLGVTTGALWSSISDWIFNRELSLTPSSTNYGMWKETPIPMYLKLYLFNWTNPKDFTANSIKKPNFVEMGPYVFRQVDYKVNQIWNDNGTITFQTRKVWHFDESLSNGRLTDEVTNLNAVAATAAYSVRHQSNFVRRFLNRLLLTIGEPLVVTKTVGELLFDGYNDTMLYIAQKMKIGTIPFDKFGWFYTRNGSDSYDGTFNILTGTSNLYTMGILQEWNFSNRSQYYTSSCAKIRGTMGDLWPPLPNNETVSIFVPDVCTSLDLTYENNTDFQGLTGNKYISDKTMLANSTMVPARKCYCPGGICEPNGVLNISLCKFGAPAFVSLPHFYLADDTLRHAINGMHPNKEKHEMSLTVEPITGVPMQVKAQLQLNLLVQPDPIISIYKDVQKTYIPMLWFTQETNLTSNYATQIKFLLVLPTFGAVTCFGIGAIGLLLFFIALFLCIRRSWRGEEGQVLLSKNDLNTTCTDH